MRINTPSLRAERSNPALSTLHWIATSAFGLLAMTSPVYAADDHAHEHGGQIFHRALLEMDGGHSREEGTLATWDFDGWVGTDENKLHLKSEGERAEGETHEAEFWALYSRYLYEFWDAQLGLRHDIQPDSVTYLAAGVEGLAPYFFETEAHLFVSEEGDISARLHQENEFLLTQELILQPYLELNFFAQDVEEQGIGAGLSDGEIGLQTRYEFSREFAPYMDLRYERKFGETSSIAKREGDNNDDLIASVGLRLLF
jgi:copper resistance protein B